MRDEGAEGVEDGLVIGEGKEEFVDVVVEVFGKTDVDDFEVFDVAGTGAGDKVAKVSKGLDKAFLVGAGVDDFVETK